MTPKEWKQLTRWTVLRRIGEAQQHLISITNAGEVYIAWSFGVGVRGYQSITDPENWEIAMTAREYQKRERQWLKEQAADNGDEDEGQDEDDT